MKLRNKMKLLSLAVIGLGGLALAGSAAADCPTTPSAWSSNTGTLGTVSVVAIGYDNTECKLAVSLNQGAPILAKAMVTDISPVDEPRYRAQFLIDTSELSGMDNALKQVQIFNASSASSPAGGVSNSEVRMTLVGGASGPSLRLVLADSNQGSNFQTVDVPLPTPLGINRIEFDLQQGATGSVSYWVSEDATVTNGGSPTGSVTVNNSGWSGVTQASLGMFSASNQFRSGIASSAHLYVDQFDSRRSTFIGHQ